MVANNPTATLNYPNTYTEDYQVVPQVPGGSEPPDDFSALYDSIEASGDPDFVVAVLEKPKCDEDHTHQLCCNDGLSSAARDRTQCEPCTLFSPIFSQSVTEICA